MFAAVSLLASLMAQADVAIEAPVNCQSNPPSAAYLLPTRLEKLIPTNTSIWLRELIGTQPDYQILDATQGGPVPFDVERTGLAGSVLVELRPKVMLPRNHRIEVYTDGALVATFTVNLGSDTVPPAAPSMRTFPASQASSPTCGVTGFEVQADLLAEPGLYLVEVDGEILAADLLSPIFVPASSRSTAVRLIALDLAGNRSGPSAPTIVVPDQASAISNGERFNNTGAQLACTCTQRTPGGPGLLFGLLGLFAFSRGRARARGARVLGCACSG